MGGFIQRFPPRKLNYRGTNKTLLSAIWEKGLLILGYIVVDRDSKIDMKGLFFLYPVFSNGFG